MPLRKRQSLPTLTLADRAYVLDNGRITLEGSGRALLQNEHLKQACLGTA